VPFADSFNISVSLGLSLGALVFLSFVLSVLWRGWHRDPRMGWAYCVLQTAWIWLSKIIYRIRVKDLEKLPKEGGVLLVSNHVSYMDVVILGLVLQRPIRFLSWEGFERHWVMRLIMRTMGTIPVAEEKAKDAIHRAAEALQAGEVVCIFPEGHVTRNGGLLPLRRGFELIARRANVPIVPVAIDGLWGSIFSFSGGKFFWKWPKHFPRPIAVVVGAPYAASEHLTTRTRLLDLAAQAFAMRPALNGNLAREVVRGLKAKGGRVALVDRTAERREFSGTVLLALASRLAVELTRRTTVRRVGIVLPPGVGATVANLACVMAGKVPVNINFTSGRSQVESCLARAEIDLIISAQAFQTKLAERFRDFPWGERVLDVADALRAMPRWRLGLEILIIRLLPLTLLNRYLGLPRQGGDDEAALLFTSGSVGEPKGVVLSHRNILANLRQIEHAGILPQRAVMLSSLPVFHSFGFTVGLWYCLSREATLVTVPSPLDTAAHVEAIRAEHVTVTVGTPTFLRPFLRRATKEDMSTVEWVVVGAEKMPEDLASGFVQQLDTLMLEGYGITETSPVLSVNLPNRVDVEAPDGVWPGNVPGSVGRPVIGVAVRFVDVESGELLALGQTGLLEVKGANVFKNYLGDPVRTAEVLHDGWYRTGDLGRMDDAGFLYLEGRLSRFSKIGGEMVPHGVVEQAILNYLSADASAELMIAVGARADGVKGEQLVVLHTVELDTEAVRAGLVALGLPALWIPKVFKKVPAVPILGTGKLDLRKIRQLAEA
jgi:acyl-[acyl-carrier-protein]-phospholipid O-acyltransferase/long-chain-fatty-acid--[acyl-carrier-protein] ligase